MSYVIRTTASWSQTMRQITIEMDRWGIKEWSSNYPNGAERGGFTQDENARTVIFEYYLRGKHVKLQMGSQARAIDNLRVIYLAIKSMRLNEKRGIGEVMEQAYKQLAAPEGKMDPYQLLGMSRGFPMSVYEAMYKDLAKVAHPDAGGTPETFKQLNEAIEEIRKENK
jgi:hypothetical protein